MRNMELCTKLMSHTVCNSKARCIEGKTCQAGCYMHFLSCMHIASIKISSQKEYAANLHRFFCKCC